MFVVALSIGIYSYIIFFLGILGLLYKEAILIATSIFFLITFYPQRRYLREIFWKIRGFSLQKLLRQEKIVLLGSFVLLLQVFVNLIGALGPERAFDALWYHLTLPKVYLDNQSIFYIPGGLLYYSAMPKLAEMLYIPALAFNGEILVKVIHFSFGLLTCWVLYALSRKFFSSLISLIAVIIFYSNLVVAWESITAYVDLVRAFFEVLALAAFVMWSEEREKRWMVLTAFMLGLAITTKLLALGSLGIFALLIVMMRMRSLSALSGLAMTKRMDFGVRNDLMNLVEIVSLALLIPLPWFLFSYFTTGNPVFPFFTSIYPITSGGAFNPFFMFSEWWILFTRAADPISPLYLMFLPLVFVFYRNFNPQLKLVTLYSFFALIMWYFTPRTGGGRFIMPYLPAFSLVCAAVIAQLMQGRKYHYLVRFLLGMILFISFITMGYRFAANSKYIPVIIGTESKENFLSNNLNYSYGDFFDSDGYFTQNIKPSDTILLYGFHNLYYIDFPFIDSSWVNEGDTFNYVATQNTALPERFKDWKLVYSNKKTLVNLYSGGKKWVY